MLSIVISHQFYGARFRGQEDQSSSTKVPSVLYYDLQGHLRASGAEINDPELAFMASDEGWIVVEWCDTFMYRYDFMLLLIHFNRAGLNYFLDLSPNGPRGYPRLPCRQITPLSLSFGITLNI